MGVYKSTDVTMILDGLDLIRHGRVAGAPLNQESPVIELPVLGDSYTETRGGAPTASVALDAYADSGTLGVLARIKDQVDDDEGVPASYGVQGSAAGKRVWHFPSVDINGYGVTPTLGGYARCTATLTSGDVTYPHAIIVHPWTDSTGKGQATAPATNVAGQDTEPDGAHAVYGVDVVREGTDDYLVFASAGGARVPVVKAGDKWEIYRASGTATWTPRTVTLAASSTGKAEITAGLTSTQRAAFDRAQAAGAIMAARPVETRDGGIVVWYVESANFGDRERLRFRLWERSGTSGAWGAARAYPAVAHDDTLPTTSSITITANPIERYVVCTHEFDQGTAGGDADLAVRFRCEFIRHMTYTQL